MSGPYLDSDLNNLKERETERKKGGKKREIRLYIGGETAPFRAQGPGSGGAT